MGGGGGRNHQTAPSLMPVSAHSADYKIIDLHSKILTVKWITFLTSSSVYNSARRGTDQLSLLMVTEHVILFKIKHLLLN